MRSQATQSLQSCFRPGVFQLRFAPLRMTAALERNVILRTFGDAQAEQRFAREAGLKEREN